MKPLIKLSLIASGIICVTAFIWAINTEDRDLPGTLFVIGWLIGAIGILSNMFLMDSSTPMAKPLKIFAVGFSIAILGALYKFLTGNSPDILMNIGFAICAAGIAWGVFSVGKHT